MATAENQPEFHRLIDDINNGIFTGTELRFPNAQITDEDFQNQPSIADKIISIDFSGNQIKTATKLPERLLALLSLNLSENQITDITLPPTWTYLSYASLEDNPIKDIKIPVLFAHPNRTFILKISQDNLSPISKVIVRRFNKRAADLPEPTDLTSESLAAYQQNAFTVKDAIREFVTPAYNLETARDIATVKLILESIAGTITRNKSVNNDGIASSILKFMLPRADARSVVKAKPYSLGHFVPYEFVGQGYARIMGVIKGSDKQLRKVTQESQQFNKLDTNNRHRVENLPAFQRLKGLNQRRRALANGAHELSDVANYNAALKMILASALEPGANVKGQNLRCSVPGIMINGINHQVDNLDFYVIGKLFIELNATHNVPVESLNKLMTALDAKNTGAIRKLITRDFGKIFHPDKYATAIASTLAPYATAFNTVYNEDLVVKGYVDKNQKAGTIPTMEAAFAKVVFSALQDFIPIDPDTITRTDPATQVASRKEAAVKYATNMAQIKPILKKILDVAIAKPTAVALPMTPSTKVSGGLRFSKL